MYAYLVLHRHIGVRVKPNNILYLKSFISIGLLSTQIVDDTAAGTNSIWKRVEKSYHESSKELLDVLKGKKEFLAMLKL